LKRGKGLDERKRKGRNKGAAIFDWKRETGRKRKRTWPPRQKRLKN